MSDTSTSSSAGLIEHPLLGELLGGLEQGEIDLPPLPAVAAEVSSLLADPDASAPALAELVQRDLALSGEILRISNSAAYAPRTPVVSLQQAIAWLGMTEIQQIVFAICVHGEVFTAPGHEDEIERLWRESIAAGLWAKELARLKRRNVETAYLAGLLHRAGRAAALSALGRVEAQRDEPVEPIVLTAVLDACEAPFGAALGERWQLPEPVVAALTAWRAGTLESGVEALQTHLAHLLAVDTLRPEPGEGELDVDPAALEALNIYLDDLVTLRARTDEIRGKAAIL